MLQLFAKEVRTPQNPRKHVSACDEYGKLRFSPFTIEFPEAKEVRAILTKLPLGKVRLMGALSQIRCNFKNNGYTVDIGWLSHKIPLVGQMIAEPSGLDKGITKSLFNIGSEFPLKTTVFHSDEGLYVSAICRGDFVKGDGMLGYFIYIKD